MSLCWCIEWSWVRHPTTTGYGFLGCAADINYTQPGIMSADFGAPMGACAPVHQNNGSIFRREYEKATVEVNCDNWTSKIVTKPPLQAKIYRWNLSLRFSIFFRLIIRVERQFLVCLLIWFISFINMNYCIIWYPCPNVIFMIIYNVIAE